VNVERAPARWAWPFGAKQLHVRANPGEAKWFKSGWALCKTMYMDWYPPRPDVQDDDERCCAKCAAMVGEERR